MDQKIEAQVVRVERKTFTISLNENPRGRFVRIMEMTAGNMSDAVVIPTSGLSEVVRVLQGFIPAEPGGGVGDGGESRGE
jgi:hypothetical protein